MPRGNTPRQPARTGRQEGARKARQGKGSAAVLRTARTGEGARPHTVRATGNAAAFRNAWNHHHN